MADTDTAHAEALHKLQAMLNLTLTEIGRIFDNPNRRRPDTITRTKSQLRSVVGEAKLNFHDALDELETELSTARDVMRRDLAVLLDQRRTKEEKVDETAQDVAMADADDAAAPPRINGDAAATGVDGGPSNIVKTESPDKKPSNADASKSTENSNSTKAAEASRPDPGDQSGTKTTATTTTSAPDDPASNTDTAPPVIDSNDGMDTDFLATFADLPAVDGNGDDGLDGSLDFDMGGTGELLPGLESYANLGSDLQTAPLDGVGDGTTTTTTAAEPGGQSTAGEFDFSGTGAGVDGGAGLDGDLGDGTLDIGNNSFADLFDFDDMDGGAEGGVTTDIDELFNSFGDDAN